MENQVDPFFEAHVRSAGCNRRSFLAYAALAVGTPLVAAACSSSGAGTAGDATSGATTSGSPTGSAPAATSSSSTIDVEAAKSEGGITFYTTTAEDAAQGVADGFKKRYGIDATYYHANSTPMAQRIDAEAKAGKIGGDVLMMDIPLMSSLSKYFATWEPPSRAPISAQYKSPQYTAVRLYVAALAWNTDLVKDPPQTWSDLADPKWKGKIAIVNANQTIVGVQLFDMLKSSYGSDYLKALAANKPRVDQTGIAISQELGAGAVAAGSTYDYALFTNAPVAGVIPPLTIATGTDVGVFKDTKKPNAARLFYDYACSAEGQVALNSSGHSIATHPDAKVPEAHTLNDVHQIFDNHFETLTSRSADLLNEFNALFG